MRGVFWVQNDSISVWRVRANMKQLGMARAFANTSSLTVYIDFALIVVEISRIAVFALAAEVTGRIHAPFVVFCTLVRRLLTLVDI